MLSNARPKYNANKNFLPKMTKFGIFVHCRLIWCPVGWLVGGCSARAVSRKTPIYFICFYIWAKMMNSSKMTLREYRNVEIFPSMRRTKRGWILLICLSIEGVPETSEGHPVLANRKAGLSSRKQQLKQSWRRYKKWKLLPLLFELAFMNCQFRWEISFQQITRQRLIQS